MDQGHGNPHTHPQQCHTVQGHPTHYFLVDLFIFFNEAYLLTLSSSVLTRVQSTALWCFNGTLPPSSSLQQSATRRWKVLLLYWVIILLLFLVQWPASSHLSIWRPNRQTKHSRVAFFAVLPSSFRQPNWFNRPGLVAFISGAAPADAVTPSGSTTTPISSAEGSIQCDDQG